MSKPMLLLDIDGVVNIFTGKVAGREMISARADNWPLWLHPDHPEWVNELSMHFDMVWSTMWQAQVVHFAQVAGFGHDWPWINFDSHYLRAGNLRTGEGVGSYKHPGIELTIRQRPAVVIDDDLEPWQHEWADIRTHSGIPTHLIQPDPFEGLKSSHLEQALAFAQACEPK